MIVSGFPSLILIFSRLYNHAEKISSKMKLGRQSLAWERIFILFYIFGITYNGVVCRMLTYAFPCLNPFSALGPFCVERLIR